MTFTRDRFTWLAYLLLGFYAFYQASLSPVMPFLQAELGLNFTQSGYFFSAFALGMILAGLGGERLVRRFGRRALLWGGAGGLALGVLALLLSPTAVLSITAVLFMGTAGTLIPVSAQAALSDQYGEQRAVALTEANVVTISCAAAVPLLVSVAQATGLGWRAGLLLPLLFLVLLATRGRDVPVPRAQAGDDGAAGGRLSPLFWLYWLAIFLGVAAEWCIVLWTPAYLETVSGFGKTAAAASASILLGGMIVGRIAGSRLARHYAPQVLLPPALLLALAGFLLFWRATAVPVTLLGLLLTGPALSNIFTLILSLATGAAANQADQASARLMLGGGLAIFLAPLILGTVADQLGMQAAFGIAGGLLLATLAVALLGRWVAARPLKPVLRA